MGKKITPAERALTARQQEWLRHLRAIERSGQRVKDYAAEQELPVQALYQAAKRLRKQGLLPPSGRRPAKPMRFAKVAVAPGPAAGAMAWRVRLANGTVFECGEPLPAETVMELIERMGRAG
jgi:hypothetical protein